MKQLQDALRALNEETARLMAAPLNPESRTRLDAIQVEHAALVADIARYEQAAARTAALNNPTQARVNAGLSRQDQADLSGLSICKMLRAAASGGAIRLDGIEAEMAAEGANEARAAGVPVDATGFFVPSRALMFAGLGNRPRADLTAGGSGTGAEAIFPQAPGSVVDILWNKLVFRGLGAQILTGLTGGSLPFPRMSAGGAPAWKAENGATDEATPGTAVVTMTPKRLPALVQLSDQLLVQDTIGLEAWVRNYLANQLAVVLEADAINGSGTSPVPRGILNTSGIGSVAGGTNGAAPTWANIIGLETLVSTANADVGNVAYLTNQAVRGKLKATPKVASTDSRMIWEGNDQPLNGYRAEVTGLVPATLDKGTATGVCSAIIFGNFADLVIAQWGGLFLKADPYTNASTGLTNIHAALFADAAVLRPASFAAMKDALTA